MVIYDVRIFTTFIILKALYLGPLSAMGYWFIKTICIYSPTIISGSSEQDFPTFHVSISQVKYFMRNKLVSNVRTSRFHLPQRSKEDLYLF